MTPVVDKCTQSCEFCWRVTPKDVGISWDQVNVEREQVDPVETLMDDTLKANLMSLGGYNPEIAVNVSEEKYREARDPKHVAISLAGEPTLYPLLSELILEIRKRNMTSFLVTNGTQPQVIREMVLPTQLYITLAAPNEKTYKQLCHPGIKNGWDKIVESQETLQSLDGRTVNRLTMVSDYNMEDARSYSELILTGEPDFVEVKGYMYLGSSRGRLESGNAPTHREIRAFSQKIADLTGYYMADEQVESRVVLLSKTKHIKKIDMT